MNEKIWLSSPHMGGMEQKFVNEAFDSNWVAPLGPNVNGFEKDLENYLGEDVFVAALSSGTSAIHLALILLGVNTGDEVICQSMTFSASANPIIYQKAIPVFVDSESDTWNIDPQLLEDAIKDRINKGKKVKAIIPVHLYGMPAKMNEILAIAEKYGIPVIEDAAEALGSTYHNRKMGTFGHMSCLSFNGNKIITTSGGGALVSKDESFIKKARFLSTQARDKALHYEHSEIGYNYRMSNICAGIGRGQMLVLNDRVAKRRAIFQEYVELFAGISGISYQREEEGMFSNRWLSTFVFENKQGVRLNEQIRKSLDEDNIESRPLWKPMHLQPVFQGAPFYGSGISETLFDNGICLPSGSNMTEGEWSRITEKLLQLVPVSR